MLIVNRGFVYVILYLVNIIVSNIVRFKIKLFL